MSQSGGSLAGIPALVSGQGLIWNGAGWTATDIATQAELAAAQAALQADIAAVQAELDALEVERIDVKHEYGAVGDGIANDSQAIWDAYTDWAAVISDQSEQYGSPLLRSLYFSAGDYYAPDLDELVTTSNYQTFEGDGLNTRIRGLSLRIAHSKCAALNMKLTDAGTYGVVLDDRSQVANGGSGDSGRRFFGMRNVHIRDRTYGWAQLDSGGYGAVINCIFEKNDEGLYMFADNSINTDRGDIWFTNCKFISNNSYGAHLRKGGNSFSDCKFQNNGLAGLYMRPTLASTNEVVRGCYFANCSFEGTQETRTVAITGITNNGDGTVTLTTAAPHNYTADMSVKIKDTTDYNGTFTVVSVPSTTTLTITAAYTSSQSGTLYTANWDVLIDSEDPGRPYNVNDCMFVGGDINYLSVNAGYNISFHGTQVKNQFWIGEPSNKIVLYNTTRGRSGASGFKDIPISGSANGWSEFAYFDTDNNATNTGGYATIRTPYAAGGLVGNVPAYYNEIRVAEDGISIITRDKTITVDPTTGVSGMPATQLVGALREAVVDLTDAATIATDASLGNTFKVTLGGNRTIGNPTNPARGQKILYRLIQDATGSRTVTWDTKFRFSTDTPAPVLTTTAGKVDYVGFIYSLTDDKWDCLGYNRGF